MASNETAYKASQKYKANIIKRAPLDMQVTDFEKLKSAAGAAGESVNGYIKRAIRERMKREDTTLTLEE